MPSTPSPRVFDADDLLDTAARRAAIDPAGAIDSVPRIASSIAEDRDAGRFAAWGWSTVIDEVTRGPVLEPAIFDELHERAAIEATWPVGNAGLIHCYAYLFSSAWTPHGRKRDRWLTPQLARTYGLADDAFVPWSASTLLQRAGDAMERVLRSPDSTRLDIDVDGTATQTAVFGTGSRCAVAYAVDGLLVTTFPIAAPATDVLTELRSELPRLRWNAVSQTARHGGTSADLG